jgi:hypothetical protein
MPDDAIIWPMGMTDRDLSDRPIVFHPRGFLVANVIDADEAGRAVIALRAAGFAQRKVRVYSSQQILADHESYTSQRSIARRVVGALTTTRRPSPCTSATLATAPPRCGSTSWTTSRPTAPCGPSQTATRSASGTTAAAGPATSPPAAHLMTRRSDLDQPRRSRGAIEGTGVPASR